MIRVSADHTRSVYAITFPQDHWTIRWIIRLLGPLAGLFLPFRVRFSQPEVVRIWLREEGFERVCQGEMPMWHIEVYRRHNGAGREGESIKGMKT